MASYATAVERLYELGHELARTPAHKFDLAHMRALTAAMAHPERRFGSVLIAGTNGKGSTAATLASILHAAGHRTALYTSPHLMRVNERLHIDGEAISDAEFTAVYNRVDDVARQLVAAGVLPHEPSFFETLTAMAFEYFAMAGVEIAVLEVGMGGRLDATNIVEPCLTVITDIALDHQKFLGETLPEIAREKAGIMRAGVPLVLLPQHPQVNDVLGREAERVGARAVSGVPYMPPVTPGSNAVGSELRSSYRVSVLGQDITLESPLVGRHQLRNLALAVAAAVELQHCGFRVTPEAIARGVCETAWPGRFQVLPGSPRIVLDVAHNPAGAWALRAALSEHFADVPLVFVFGAMRDKAIGEMAEILFPLATAVIATHAASPRAATPEEIRGAAARTGAELHEAATVTAALGRARELAPQHGAIVVTGSIYVVGEALVQLQPSS